MRALGKSKKKKKKVFPFRKRQFKKTTYFLNAKFRVIKTFFQTYVRANKKVVRDRIFCLRSLTLFSEDRLIFSVELCFYRPCSKLLNVCAGWKKLKTAGLKKPFFKKKVVRRLTLEMLRK